MSPDNVFLVILAVAGGITFYGWARRSFDALTVACGLVIADLVLAKLGLL